MYLHTLGATLTGDGLYFAASDFNALFFMDFKERQIRYKTYFAEFDKSRGELYGKQILHKGKIYFIPRSCNKVAVYDTETEKISYIELRGKGEGLIRDAFIEDNHLWMLYVGFPVQMIKVNLFTGKCDMTAMDWNKVSAQIGYPERSMSPMEKRSVFGSAKQIGKYWWMFAERNGYLVDYDWKGNKVRAEAFAHFRDKAVTADVREKVWIMARDENRALEYNYKEKTENWLCLQGFDEIPGDVMRIVEQDEIVLFIKTKGMAVMQKETHASQSFRFSEEKNLMSRVVYDGKIILLPGQGKGMIVYDLTKGGIEEYAFEWKEKVTGDNLQKYFSGCIREESCKLQDFAGLVPEKRSSRCGNQGKTIWDALCGK